MSRILAFFSTSRRQAVGWTLLGLLGIGMAAGGVWFLTDDGGSPRVADADALAGVTAAPTATRTATPTATATVSPTPTPTEAPGPTATTAPRASTGTGGAGGTGGTGGTGGGTGGSTSPSAPEPTPTPVPPVVVASGAYCPPRASNGVPSLPSARVAGAVKVGGVDAAEGSVEVFVAFDGVLGPSTKNTVGPLGSAFRIDFYANVAECANHVGAAISAYANGIFFPTGRSVGDGGLPLIPVTIDLP